MHVEQHIKQGATRVAGTVVRLKELALRRKRAAIALLVIGPLLMTGDVEVFVLNGIGLAIAALAIRCVVNRSRRGSRRRERPAL